MAKKAAKGQAYCVQSKVKELVKKLKMKCSSDVIDALNHHIAQQVTKGVERAKANGRKTLRGSDL
jgi:histone H3/H4